MSNEKSSTVIPVQRAKPVVEPVSSPRVGTDVPADYRRSVDVTRHTAEHVVGNKTTVKSETQTDDNLSGEFDNRVITLVNGTIQERQKAEDGRANHRNFNRLLTLLGAVIIGLILTYASVHGYIPKAFSPYTFVITVLLDSTFTMYALWKHY